MTALEYIALAMLVAASSGAVDYAAARWSRAVVSTEPGSNLRAAYWTVLQWTATSVGFACAVWVSKWLLPWEAVGLFAGTLLGGAKPREAESREAHDASSGYQDVWHHVEDSESVQTEPRTYEGGVSSMTLAHSIFRCGNCRALAVALKGATPSNGCGKCGTGKPASKR